MFYSFSFYSIILILLYNLDVQNSCVFYTLYFKLYQESDDKTPLKQYGLRGEWEQRFYLLFLSVTKTV